MMVRGVSFKVCQDWSSPFIYLILLLSFLGCSPSWATNPTEPLRGPVPSWVTPRKIPAVPTTPTDLPSTVLLLDQQQRLEGETLFSYWEGAIHINNEKGLSAATISVPWEPEFGTLTIHKINILRDGKTIDALAGEKAITVLRREKDLENATLDGVLTASIIADGVRVGDTVHLAFTQSHYDPLFPGALQYVGPIWRQQPLEQGHVRIEWPVNRAMQVKLTGDLAPLVRKTAQGYASIEMTMEKTDPAPAPASGPPRYRFQRLLQVSSFPSWTAVAASQVPLYEKASRLKPDSPLWAEIARIKALSADPVVRTEATLTLVQRQIRYVALAMGVGGYMPADVDVTWNRRFGDCKGKTVMLLALLRELGVQAEAVLVNTDWGDGLDQRLPMVDWFNHVLVRATIDGKSYWLDGTRADDQYLAQLQVPTFRWGLPVLAGPDTGLIAIEPPPLSEPEFTLSIALDARAGVDKPAQLTAEQLFRGDEAISVYARIVRKTGNIREQYLREYWRRSFTTAVLDQFDVAFNSEKRELRLTMQGSMNLRWRNGRYLLAGLITPPLDRPDRPPADRTAPVGINYPAYRVVRQTIRLPVDAGPFSLDHAEPVTKIFGAHDFRVAVSLQDNVVHAESSIRSLAFETSYEDVMAAVEWIEGWSVPEIVRSGAKPATLSVE